MKTRQDVLRRLGHRMTVTEAPGDASDTRTPAAPVVPTSSKPAARRSRQPRTVPSPQVEAAQRALKTKPQSEGTRLKIDASVVARSRAKPPKAKVNPFDMPSHPPGVRVPPEQRIAADEAIAETSAWAWGSWNAGGFAANAFAEGVTFLGYTYLAELAQRPEYRVISETIATEMTRKWIRLQAKGDEDKSERIAELEDELKRLKVRDIFCKAAEVDGFFGRAHLYLDTGDGDDPAELRKPIGDGRSKLSRQKVGKGDLKRLAVVEPTWCYPSAYNSNDPLAPDWYNPQEWFVMQKRVHQSRLLRFVGREVPDLLKPTYSFGGLALSQIVKPYVDNWLNIRQSVADIIQAFSVFVLSTDMQAFLQAGGDEIFERADLFNNLRSNRGLMMTDKNAEDFKNVAAPLGTLDALQAQAQEHMASVSRIPLVKLLGISPHGLNASSEGELRAFYDSTHAYQERFFSPNLNRVIAFAMLNLWGEVDEDITFVYEPLWALDEKGEAEVQKIRAETDTVHIDNGTVSAEEARKRVASDPDTPYQGLDINNMPEPPGEEQVDENDPEGGGVPPIDPNGGGPESDGSDKEGGGRDAVLPFAGAKDAWNEGDHPRRHDGKFGSGGGTAPLDVSKLHKVGKQMGSNEGGVFEDVEGNRFYVKKGQSADHVKNELIAASMYRLAGAPTLTYRPVEGGTHIATEMKDLGKKRVSEFSPAEKKKAAEDFAVHAWLGNWDAVGTGGDNQGAVDGVPTSLDLGGAMEYRAQGAPKGAAFGTGVSELDTLRNPKTNPDGAKLFGKMTADEIQASARKVTRIPNAEIEAAVKAGGGTPELAKKLIARKEDLAKRTGAQAHDEAQFEEGKHPRDKDGKFAKGAGGGGAATKAQTSEKPKKGAFGGYSVTNGTSPKNTHDLNVAKMLAQPVRTGISYKSFLQYLINQSKEFGTEKEVAPLKDKLTAAWLATGDELTKKGDEAGAKKAYAKAKSLDAGGTVKQIPITTSAPKPAEKVETKQAAKAEPKAPLLTPEQTAIAQGVIDKAKKFQEQVLQIPASYSTLAKGKETVKAAVQNGVPVNYVKAFLGDAEQAAMVKQYGSIDAAYEKGQKYFEAQQKAKAEQVAQELAEKKSLEALPPADKASVEDLAGIVGAQQAKANMQTAASRIAASKALQASGISPAQASHIVAYYGHAYREINKQLRAGAMTVEQWKHVKQLNDALEKLPPFVGVTRRGSSLKPEQLALYKPGMVIEERGFTSTSTGSGFGGDVSFEVHGTSGRDIQQLSNYPNEKEVLFKSGTRFVVDKHEKKGGKTVIVMKEV